MGLNELRGDVEIKLDKPRRLRYTLNSLALIEERYGDVQKAIESLQAGKLSVIRTILWAGLVHEDETLTENQVGDLVEISDLQQVTEKINQAFARAVPEPVKNAVGAT